MRNYMVEFSVGGYEILDFIREVKALDFDDAFNDKEVQRAIHKLPYQYLRVCIDGESEKSIVMYDVFSVPAINC